MTTAYPRIPVRIFDFQYHSNLLLTRTISAVQRREGEDADYIVAQDFDCSIEMESIIEKTRFWKHVSVPFGFITDLSSTPRLARPIVGRVGPHLEASIVHDWLYVAWQAEDIKPTETMRRFADDVFLAAMTAAHVPPVTKRIAYRAVRLFGKTAFYGRDERLIADPD